MDPAPLPPHEREWRHPSEVAAEARAAVSAELPSTPVRAVALLGGATGVLLIGLVVLTITPRGDGSPSALSSTTIPRFAVAAPVALTAPVDATDAAPRATPIGDDGLAVITTRAAVDVLRRTSSTVGDEIVVQFAGGDAGTARIVHLEVDDDLAIVELTDGGDHPGLELADEMPEPDDVVTVLTDPPMHVTFDVVAGLDLADGTAVLDAGGELVGVCTDDVEHADPGPFILVGDELGGATGPGG